jgi:hypothetical protein
MILIHSFGIGVVGQLNADKKPRMVKVLSSLSIMLQDLVDHHKTGRRRLADVADIQHVTFDDIQLLTTS